MRTMFLVMVLALVGCGDEAGQEKKAQPTAVTQGETEGVVYECPMHCKLEGHDEPYTQEESGECPVCGMELKPQSGE